MLFLHLCENWKIFLIFFLIWFPQVWLNTYIGLYKLSATRHSGGGREKWQEVCDQSTLVVCWCGSSTEWDWAGGRRENGLCRVAFPRHFQTLATWAVFFLTSVYDRCIIALILHMRTPKPRVSEWLHQLLPGVSGGARTHTNCWDRMDKAGSRGGCLHLWRSHTWPPSWELTRPECFRQ